MRGKAWVVPFRGTKELDKLLSSVVRGNTPEEVFVHPDSFKELCDKLELSPDEILGIEKDLPKRT